MLADGALAVTAFWDQARFSFEVLEFLAGREARVAHHIRRVVDLDAMDIDPRFASHRGYSEPDASFVNSMLADYKLNLRGKTLMEVLITHLSDSRRNPKYSYAAIVELCLKLYPENPYMKRLVAEANRRLS